MKPHLPKDFEQNYQTHLKCLKLNSMQPKTIEAYSRAVRRADERFGYQIDALTEQQLTLENPAVHEKHEKARTYSNRCNNKWLHLSGDSQHWGNQLIGFVTFVFFVDEKRF